MERRIDRIMFQKIAIGTIVCEILDLVFAGCLLILSFFIRFFLMPVESGDYIGFLQPWMQEIRGYGGMASLGFGISNYSSAYMILMSLLSYIDSSALYLLKSLSFVFDYAAGMAMFLIIYHITGNVRKSILGMGGVLLLPTVIINGAFWCQCDIIYSTFLLFAFYYICKAKSLKAMWMVSFAFAFKLQTLLILPFLVIMWLKQKGVRFRDFILIPLVYILSAAFVWMFGRNFREAIGVYFEQTDYYPWLTLNYPNLYALFSQVYPDSYVIPQLGTAGIFFAAIMIGSLAYYLYSKKIMITNEMMVTIALISIAIMVYCLPHMHERYGFLIDLFAVLYAIIRLEKMPVSIGLVMVSLLSYMPFLTGKNIVPLHYLALIQLGLIVLLIIDLKQQIKKQGEFIIPESIPSTIED